MIAVLYMTMQDLLPQKSRSNFTRSSQQFGVEQSSKLVVVAHFLECERAAVRAGLCMTAYVVGIAERNVLRLDVDTFAESQVCNAVIQQTLSLVNATEFPILHGS